MKIRLLFCLIATTCIFSLGFAQCPDSVQVYVFPEVICPGEVAILSTDSILCANIGDIICVHNDTHDTIIVSPSDWTRLGLANSPYTPLSVVFYVDETCHHGWAVQCTTYETQKWDSRRSPADEASLINYTSERSALSDLDGFHNTNNVLANHPAFASCTTPFYLPAIGQLNILFPIKNSISSILTNTLSRTSLPDDSWWSSTENTQTFAYYLDNSGGINSNKKTDAHYVIPVMNF